MLTGWAGELVEEAVGGQLVVKGTYVVIGSIFNKIDVEITEKGTFLF